MSPSPLSPAGYTTPTLAAAVGDLVSHPMHSRANEPNCTCVSKITDITYTVVDGSGHERQVRVADASLADMEQQRDYWMTRAIHAERSGYGSPLSEHEAIERAKVDAIERCAFIDVVRDNGVLRVPPANARAGSLPAGRYYHLNPQSAKPDTATES